MQDPALIVRLPDGSDYTMYTPTEKGKEFHLSDVSKLIAMGNRGGGKSVMLRFDAHMRALSCPGSNLILVRKSYKELLKSHVFFQGLPWGSIPFIMQNENVEKKIQEIADTIVREYKPEKIVLFGSWAWGEPHKDSDFDFFIIKETKTPTLKRIEEVDRIFSRREFPMDFLVYTPEQVKNRLEIGDLFIKDVLTNGKVLYEAAR